MTMTMGEETSVEPASTTKSSNDNNGTTTTTTTNTGLPSPWTVRYSRSKKREYFFNPTTKQSQWDVPPDTDKSQLHQYLKEHPLRVRCLHILIKHNGSRRPVSSRTSARITIDKQQAIKELEEIQQKLVGHQSAHQFEQLAKLRSDCSSYKRGGDLGWFGKGEMQPAFEEAAFGLGIGEVSGIVETDSGVHLIKRVG